MWTTRARGLRELLLAQKKVTKEERLGFDLSICIEGLDSRAPEPARQGEPHEVLFTRVVQRLAIQTLDAKSGLIVFRPFALATFIWARK